MSCSDCRSRRPGPGLLRVASPSQRRRAETAARRPPRKRLWSWRPWTTLPQIHRQRETMIMVRGADWAFTISAGLRGHSILAAVSGLVLGYAAMTIVVAAGVGALVARSPAFLTGLTIAGGLYLMWHGARALARPSAPGTPAGAPASTTRATLVKGVGVSGLNP